MFLYHRHTCWCSLGSALSVIQLSTRRIIVNLNAAAGVCMFLNTHVLVDHACCKRHASAQSTYSLKSSVNVHSTLFFFSVDVTTTAGLCLNGPTVMLHCSNTELEHDELHVSRRNMESHVASSRLLLMCCQSTIRSLAVPPTALLGPRLPPSCLLPKPPPSTGLIRTS